jgi:hypothetical protein
MSAVFASLRMGTGRVKPIRLKTVLIYFICSFFAAETHVFGLDASLLETKYKNMKSIVRANCLQTLSSERAVFLTKLQNLSENERDRLVLKIRQVELWIVKPEQWSNGLNQAQIEENVQRRQSELTAMRDLALRFDLLARKSQGCATEAGGTGMTVEKAELVERAVNDAAAKNAATKSADTGRSSGATSNFGLQTLTVFPAIIQEH